jgi:hypothetical protein
MSGNRKLLIALGLIAVVISSVWTYFSSSLDITPLPTTFSVSPSGCKALYESMEELGLPATRLLSDYTNLDKYKGTLVVIDPLPLWRSFTKREIRGLKRWIRKGNKLLLFAGPSLLSLNMDRERIQRKKKKGGLGKYTPLHNQLGLYLKDTEKEGRSPLNVKSESIHWTGVATFSDKIRWDGPGDEWTVLAEDELGPIIIRRNMGSGAIVAVSDSSLLTNGKVGQEDNFRFFLSLALKPGTPEQDRASASGEGQDSGGPKSSRPEEATPGPGNMNSKIALFDEFHHGYGEAKSVSTFFKASVFYLVLAQVILLAIFYFYSKRAMLVGAYRTLTRARGRGSYEYVDSMANLFESCNAGSQALSALLRRFEALTRLSRGLGAPHGEVVPTWSGFVKDPEVAREIEQLLDECRQAIKNDADVSSSVKLAARLARTRDKLRSSKGRA